MKQTATEAQGKLAEIQAHLNASKANRVVVATHLKATVYDSRHVGGGELT